MKGDEKREEGVGGGRGRGSGRVKGTVTLGVGSSKQVRYILLLFLCFILFLLFLIFFQISFASSPPPPVQTGTSLPLNPFSLASLAPDIVEVAAVNNTAGCRLVAAVDHATTRQWGARLSNGQRQCNSWMRRLCYLE